MTSRERVLRVLHHELPDRVPLNIFAGWNEDVREAVERSYGSVEDFCDKLHIDIVTGVIPLHPWEDPLPEPLDLDTLLSARFRDPRSDALLESPAEGRMFLTIREAVEKYGSQKAVFAHAWGVFELVHFQLGLEEALVQMALERDKMRALFQRLAEWSATTVEKAVAAGVDVIELSDDWGQNRALLFRPDDWWELIYPCDRLIVDVAKSKGVPVVLHSDGDVTEVLEGILEMGVDALHPVQESAGMDPGAIKARYGSRLALMGGLDTVSVLPRMDAAQIQEEVQRLFDLLKPGGGFIFSTSHLIQSDTPLEVVEAAYRKAYNLAAYG